MDHASAIGGILIKDQLATTIVYALGPQTSIDLRLPAEPKALELHPQHWILSEKNIVRLKK